VDLSDDIQSALGTFVKQRGPEHQLALEKLEHLIDEILNEKFPNGAFVKLNTRSPKDVPIYDFQNNRLWKMIQNEIESKPGLERDASHQVWSFIKCTNRFLKVTSGSEAVYLLSNSTRIQEDVRKMLPFRNAGLPIQLVIREWCDECPERPEFEFRGFVYKGKLNALTMYFSCNYSPQLHEQKSKVEHLITTFFYENITHKISHMNYVIDFYVAQDDTVKVIELNPFHIGAGAGLFSWKNDRELFMNGPFVFKIIEAPCLELTDELIPLKWKKQIDQKYGVLTLPKNSKEEEDSVESTEGEKCILL